jgi:DNA-binding protein YbaB
VTSADFEPQLAQAMAAVAKLRDAAEQLATTASTPRTETSPDGLVTVEAARGRLTRVSVDARAYDETAHISHIALVEALRDTVRTALEPERGSDSVAPHASEHLDQRQLQAFADREFRADRGGVAATVNGGSRLLTLDVDLELTRGDDRDELGDRVVAAVDDALGECSRARVAEFGLTGESEALQAKTDAFVARMGEIDAQMNALHGDIAARLEQVQALHRTPPPESP